MPFVHFFIFFGPPGTAGYGTQKVHCSREGFVFQVNFFFLMCVAREAHASDKFSLFLFFCSPSLLFPLHLCGYFECFVYTLYPPTPSSFPPVVVVFEEREREKEYYFHLTVLHFGLI